MKAYTEEQVIELLRQQRVDCANKYGEQVDFHDLKSPHMEIMREIKNTEEYCQDT